MSATATSAGARLRLQTQRCQEGAADGAGTAPIVVRAVRGDGGPVSWQRALEAMRQEDDFQDALSASVREAPWEAVFFETRPTSSTTAAEDVFEFVLVPSRGLQTVATADLETFAEQLAAAKSAGRATAVFTNLGGDATLVVPTIPAALADAQDAFRHVGPYFRATETLPGSTRALWQSIAESMTERMSQRGARPVWLSTSGLGVYYLHFRLDDRPKYYTYAPFKGWS